MWIYCITFNDDDLYRERARVYGLRRLRCLFIKTVEHRGEHRFRNIGSSTGQPFDIHLPHMLCISSSEAYAKHKHIILNHHRIATYIGLYFSLFPPLSVMWNMSTKWLRCKRAGHNDVTNGAVVAVGGGAGGFQETLSATRLSRRRVQHPRWGCHIAARAPPEPTEHICATRMCILNWINASLMRSRLGGTHNDARARRRGTRSPRGREQNAQYRYVTHGPPYTCLCEKHRVACRMHASARA